MLTCPFRIKRKYTFSDHLRKKHLTILESSPGSVDSQPSNAVHQAQQGSVVFTETQKWSAYHSPASTSSSLDEQGGSTLLSQRPRAPHLGSGDDVDHSPAGVRSIGAPYLWWQGHPNVISQDSRFASASSSRPQLSGSSCEVHPSPYPNRGLMTPAYTPRDSTPQRPSPTRTIEERFYLGGRHEYRSHHPQQVSHGFGGRDDSVPSDLPIDPALMVLDRV